MNRLAGRLGSGTRAGSWLRGTPTRLGCRSRADWRRRLLAWVTETKVIESLLWCGVCNKNESQPDNLLGKLRGIFLGKGPGSSPENSPQKCWEGQVARPGDLPGFLATATMIIAGPILMGAPKDRQLADQGSGSGRRPEEVGQQMTGFRGGERDERGAGHGLLLGSSREGAVDRDVDEEGVG